MSRLGFGKTATWAEHVGVECVPDNDASGDGGLG